MCPTAKTIDESPPTTGSGVSGKLLIVGIVSMAFAAAAISWWFRYNATHRAAEFWGPDVAHLIRDAPHVGFFQYSPPFMIHQGEEAYRPDRHYDGHTTEEIDISAARGLVHLRTALLEDRSFDWPATRVAADNQWRYCLRFSDDIAGAILAFSPDLKTVTVHGASSPTSKTAASPRQLSCERIAPGLREMFGEFTAAQTNEPGPRASR